MKYIAVTDQGGGRLESWYVGKEWQPAEEVKCLGRDAIDEAEDRSVGLTYSWEWRHVRVVPLFTTLGRRYA